MESKGPFLVTTVCPLLLLSITSPRDGRTEKTKGKQIVEGKGCMMRLVENGNGYGCVWMPGLGIYFTLYIHADGSHGKPVFVCQRPSHACEVCGLAGLSWKYGWIFFLNGFSNLICAVSFFGQEMLSP